MRSSSSASDIPSDLSNPLAAMQQENNLLREVLSPEHMVKVADAITMLRAVR
ncbi:hypothetical protein [Phyllobacterium zundukense]|uniref:hypothetical protein n=1 Tax=Phyllobacterium zundukense TaxID=1867719 RepID=UPI0013FDD12E|nr:hypothetical protein [Phyllobacterium zundukense]